MQIEKKAAEGLSQKIRWLDGHICDSQEEAEEYIQRNDRGWYDQLAVRFRALKEDTAKIKHLRERASAAYKRAADIRNDIHYSHCESAYIACKYCGSRLATKYIKKQYLPSLWKGSSSDYGIASARTGRDHGP